MWQNAIHRSTALLMMILLASAVFLLPGCGSQTPNGDCQAPFGSTITFLKGAATLKLSGPLPADTFFDYIVSVQYPDGKPMSKACLNISGSLAQSANTSQLWAYQFWYLPGGEGQAGNYKVFSPYEAQTDDFGQYSFSIVLTAGTGTFFDQTITARSGANVVTSTITVQ